MSPIPKTSQDQFLGLDFSYSKTTLVVCRELAGVSARVSGTLSASYDLKVLPKFSASQLLTGEPKHNIFVQMMTKQENISCILKKYAYH